MVRLLVVLDGGTVSCAVLSAARCLLSSPLIFQDVHDGDRKIVYETSSSIRIEPFDSNELWTVAAPLNFTTCTAVVDFRVPGKLVVREDAVYAAPR